MTAHWTVRRHWNSCASLAGLVLSFIACFILLVIATLALVLAIDLMRLPVCPSV